MLDIIVIAVVLLALLIWELFLNSKGRSIPKNRLTHHHR